MNESHRQAYLEEAADLLRELEGALLELEESPSNAELIGRVFRALHTIKGSGAMFGFDAVAAFTHEFETAFDSLRSGRGHATPDLIGIALEGRDHIQELLHAAPGADGLAPATAGILERLRQAAAAPEAPSSHAAEPAVPARPPGGQELQTFRVRFDPQRDILLSGTNPILLLRELAGLGDLSLAAHLDRIPRLTEFNADECYTHWDGVLTASVDENAVRDVFIFVEDRALVQVQPIGSADEIERRRLGEILVDRGDVRPDDAEKVLSDRPRIGELLVEAGLTTPDRVDAAVLEQQHVEKLRESRRRAEAASTLRIPAAKLDALVDIVGELVTVQARLSSYAVASGDSEITLIAEEVERLTAQLREDTMSARMLPIGETFSRFKRLIRDLAAELGKKIDFVAEGGETELDKTVIEQLNDPLVHLVRNAIDHGIESPEVRLAGGKPESGRIHLSACHEGAFVVIQVTDDGRGMNRDAIRARALERGMIPAGASLSDDELFALTFAPGFSTASAVTAVSGRGVGMDVVQRGLKALRGSVSIASEAGRGTTVTLKIPLTLAIIDGLLVEAGGAFFVVPLANIAECFEMEGRVDRPQRHALVHVRGEMVPYIVLRERFGIFGRPPGIEQVIVAETPAGKCGFVVDRVIGDHNTVVKKLGGMYRGVEEVSGATILGDGRIALILDVNKVASAASAL